MPADDPADIGQADTGTLEFIGAVQALKDAEELVGILHIKTHAVIAHEYYGLRTMGRRHTDFNFRLLTLGFRLFQPCNSLPKRNQFLNQDMLCFELIIHRVAPRC